MSSPAAEYERWQQWAHFLPCEKESMAGLMYNIPEPYYTICHPEHNNTIYRMEGKVGLQPTFWY